MGIKQEHSSNGDNVAGNKNEENNFYSIENNSGTINSKILELKNYSELDFSDNVVISAFKEHLIDVIKEQQSLSHEIVPIGQVRNYYKEYIEDDFFADIIRELSSNNKVTVNSVQVCYVPKDLNYTVELE